jgi:1-acyl-sn-glycerol-3-phosphate acyltransferase
VEPDRASSPPSTDSPASARPRPRGVPDAPRELLELGADQLSPVEKRVISFVRHTFRPGPVDQAMRLAQQVFGANWIELCIRNLREVRGFERLPPFDPTKSYIVVSNHRSFFDLYVITAFLVKRGMKHRLMFPVRSKFFYDAPLGLVVNGLMSFFAMYPPIFRDRARAALNLASLDEVVRLLRQGGTFVGLHPEGQRNTSDDVYALLPAQSGVGRVIQASRAVVLPVFINGLGNDMVKQVAGNFTGTGDKVSVVFGEPVDFGTMLDSPPSPRLHKKISEHVLDVIRRLGDEDKAFRAEL